MSAENSGKTATGRPFRPGQSGNPGGRPKAARDIQTRARAHTKEAIATLVKCLKGRHAVQAAVVLLDRGWGKPLQQTENVNWNENQSMPQDPLQSHDERVERSMKIAEILRKAREGNGEVVPKGAEAVPVPEVHKGVELPRFRGG